MFDKIHKICYLLLLCVVGEGVALCTQGSYLNICGHCVGGTTDRTEVEGLDRCRVCDGDSDCVGCDGIINSPRRRDICGMCLPPDAEQWNDCQKINTVYPSVLDLSLDSSLVPLTVMGAGLKKSVTNATQCLVLLPNPQTGSLEVKEMNLEENDIQLKVLLSESTGTYKIGCSEIEGFSQLRIVDSRRLHVVRVHPSEVSVDKMVEIELETEDDQSGNSREGQHWCFVRTRTGETQTFSATFQSENRYKCSNYTLQTPGVVEVGLVASEDAAFNVNGTGRTGELVVRGRAPVAETAEYGPDLQYIAISFDQNIEVSNCSGVFSPETEKSLGDGFFCTAIGDILFVTLGGDAKMVESLDILGDNAIRRLGSEDAASPEVSPNAEAAILPVSLQRVMTPTFSLSLPNVVCSDKSKQPVVAVRVSRLGKERLDYVWTIPPGKDWNGRNQRENMMMWKHMRGVEAELNDESNPDGIILTTAKLLTGIQYSVSVMSRNILGHQHSAIGYLKISENGTASVTVTTFPSTSAVAAEANVTFCTDAVQPILRYRWMINEKVISEDGRRIFVPETQPGTYNVSCVVFDHSSGRSLGAGWSLTEIVSIPKRVIVFPSEIVLGTMDDVVLEAFSDTTTVRWSCATVGREPCIAVGPKGSPIDEVVNLTTSVIRIPAETLPVGRYMWTVHANGEATAKVIISPKIPPSLKVNPPSPTVDSGKLLSLNADIERLKPGCRIRWKTLRRKGYDYFDLQQDVGLGDVINIGIDDLVTEEREVPLVVPPARGHWKGLTGGAMYLFRLQAVCPQPVPEAHLDVTVATNAPPKVFNLTVTPTSGEALNTKFAVRVSEAWDSVEDYPVRYTLSYRDDSSGDVIMEESFSSCFEVFLPPGNVTVIVAACDVRNSCTKLNINVEVGDPNNVTSQRIQDLKKEIQNLMIGGETQIAYGKAITAFKTLSPKPEMDVHLRELSSAVESSVEERLRDLSTELTDDSKLKLSFSFLEQSVTSLKYFPNSTGMVKLLTQFKNRITRQPTRYKRESDGQFRPMGMEESVLKAIFELHSRNLESGISDGLTEVAEDVRKYMLELCSSAERPFLVDLPGVSFWIKRLTQEDLKKELHIANDERTKLVLDSRSITPKTCLGTVRYLMNSFHGSKRSSPMYEVRFIKDGHFEEAPVMVTLPSPGGPNEKCFSWGENRHGVCDTIRKVQQTISCQCRNSGYITILREGESPLVKTKEMNRSREELCLKRNCNTGEGEKPTNASIGTEPSKLTRRERDVKVNEGTIKAIFDLHGKILEQNNTESNREEFLKDVRKYMIETCTAIQDSVQDPVVIESSVVLLEILKLTQIDAKKDISLPGMPEARLRFNFKSLPKKTCAGIARYRQDYLNDTSLLPRASDIYEVRLIRNGTFKDSVKDEVKSVSLVLPLYKANGQGDLNCMGFTIEDQWNSSCTVKTKTNGTITCGCRDPGIFSVFVTGIVNTTIVTAVPTSSSTPTTTVKSTIKLTNTPGTSTTSSTLITTSSHTSSTTTTPYTTVPSTSSAKPVETRATTEPVSSTTTAMRNGTTEKPDLTSVIQDISNLKGNNSGFYITGTFRIDEDFNTVVGKDEKEFKENLKNQIADQLKIPAGAIANIMVKPGSIIVTVLFVDTDTIKAEAAIKELVTKLHDGKLRLIGRNATLLNIPKQDLKVKIGPNLTRNAGKVRLITYGVVAGTLFAILLFAVGAAYFKRKRTRMPLRLPHLSIDDHPTYRQFHNEFSLDGSSASLARYRREHPFETETIQ